MDDFERKVARAREATDKARNAQIAANEERTRKAEELKAIQEDRLTRVHRVVADLLEARGFTVKMAQGSINVDMESQTTKNFIQNGIVTSHSNKLRHSQMILHVPAEGRLCLRCDHYLEESLFAGEAVDVTTGERALPHIDTINYYFSEDHLLDALSVYCAKAERYEYEHQKRNDDENEKRKLEAAMQVTPAQVAQQRAWLAGLVVAFIIAVLAILSP